MQLNLKKKIAKLTMIFKGSLDIIMRPCRKTLYNLKDSSPAQNCSLLHIKNGNIHNLCFEFPYVTVNFHFMFGHQRLEERLVNIFGPLKSSRYIHKMFNLQPQLFYKSKVLSCTIYLPSYSKSKDI